MSLQSSRHDRFLGLACLVVCPAITGLFVGLIAVVSASPTGGVHAISVGARVGGVAFVVNALAICFTATAIHASAIHRAHQAAHHAAHQAARHVLEEARSRM